MSFNEISKCIISEKWRRRILEATSCADCYHRYQRKNADYVTTTEPHLQLDDVTGRRRFIRTRCSNKRNFYWWLSLSQQRLSGAGPLTWCQRVKKGVWRGLVLILHTEELETWNHVVGVDGRSANDHLFFLGQNCVFVQSAVNKTVWAGLVFLVSCFVSATTRHNQMVIGFGLITPKTFQWLFCLFRPVKKTLWCYWQNID